MEDKIVFETFKYFSPYDICNLKKDDPTCFNGFVRVKKYRVTIEEVKEPKETIRKRLQELWDKCDNHHHWLSLKGAAKVLGVKLKTK